MTQQVARLCSCIVISAAVCLLSIWLFFPELKQFSGAMMKANTCIAFILAGTSLFLKTIPKLRLLSQGFAFGSLVIGTLSGCQYLFGVSFGIDQLLVTDFPSAESLLFPGRMSPIMASCFVLVSTTLLTLDTRFPSQLPLLPFWGLSLVAIVGYLYNTEALYKMGPYIRIAWASAILNHFLLIGIMFARPQRRLLQTLLGNTLGGAMLRRLIPVAVVVPIVLGLFVILLSRFGFVDLPFATAVLVVLLVGTLCGFVILSAEKLSFLEKEREAREKRLQQFVEQSPFAVAMLDKNMRYIFASKQWLSDFSLQIEDIRGKSHYDIFPDIPAHWREVHRRCLSGATERSDAEKFVRTNGTHCWIRWEVRPWYETENRIGGLLIFSEDIGTRITAERDLKRWEHIFQNASWGISLTSPDNYFVMVNQAFADMHGSTPANWTGRHLSEMFAEESKSQLEEWTQEVHTNGHITYESIHQRKDGTQFPVLTEVTAFRDEKENVIFRAANYLDITEKKKAEKALKESEELYKKMFSLAKEGQERLRIALDHARLGAWDWDILNNNVTWDTTTENLFGFEPGTFPGTTQAFDQSLHPEDREMIWKEVLGALETRGTFNLEYRAVWPDKSVHWLQATGLALYNREGKPYRMLGTVLETTSRRNDEEALREAIRSRDEFLSIASHELKTPLTSLLLQTQMTKREISKHDTSKVDKFVEQSEKQVSRLVRLVDDMFDVSKIRTGKLSLKRSKIDIGQMVSEVSEHFQNELYFVAKKVPLRVQVEKDIVGFWDRFRIEQVITNLLTNAVRYGNSKPIDLTVSSKKDFAVISVQDFGIGIAKESQERIFNRFERAVSASEISGLGLGLFITQQIVDAHGGHIWVESEVGQGSTFYVELPL